MKITEATKNNIPDIITLNSFVQKMHAYHYPDVFKSTVDEKEMASFFDGVLEKKENYILLAFKENKAVGYLWATFQHKSENPFKLERKQFYIHQVAVHEQYRNQNIGQALFSKLESIAKENGINNFALDSWAFNKDAHRFFEKLGFVTYNINMWKKE